MRATSPPPDLRVQLEISRLSGTNELSSSPTEDDQQETELQECWDKAIAKNMDLPDGYQDVNVLIVKWHDAIDELQVRSEVDDITRMFRDVFNYDVTEVELGASNPTLSLISGISGWAKEHDSSENLLIVYYAGHGMYDIPAQALEFSPTNDVAHMRAIWNNAEQILKECVTADVLAIMDTCYASDICRNTRGIGRKFEMIAASHIGTTTSQPGPDSFTTCLIKHMEKLARENPDSSFTTRDIVERMKIERGDQGPEVWRRIHTSSRNIRLHKLKPLQDRPKRSRDAPVYKRFLTLGFALENEIFNEEHIENLTKSLPSVFRKKGVPLADIRFMSCRKVGNPTFREVAKYVMKHRDDFSSISPISERKRVAAEAGIDEKDMGNADCSPKIKLPKHNRA